MNAVLFVIAVLAVSIAVALVSPTRRCARCNGERVTRHRWTGRIVSCPRCKGSGRHARRGARLVHSAYHALRIALAEQRQHRTERLTQGETR